MTNVNYKSIDDIKKDLLARSQAGDIITQDEVMKAIDNLKLTDEEQENFIEWTRDNGIIMEDELDEDVMKDDDDLVDDELADEDVDAELDNLDYSAVDEQEEEKYKEYADTSVNKNYDNVKIYLKSI